MWNVIVVVSSSVQAKILLTAGHRSHNQKRFCAASDCVRQRSVRRLVGPILSASEEPDKWPPLLSNVIADRPAQHRIARLKDIQHRALGNRPFNLKLDLAADPRQPAKMRRQYYPDHGNTWTSTDSTEGRSRTMGIQVSPESVETYTCPPVVPK